MKKPILNSLRLVLTSIALLVAASMSAQSQITVKGLVKDAFGPLPGATIYVPATGEGTITDESGNFSITVPAGTDVEVSFIGFSSYIIKGRDTDFFQEVILSEGEELQEVVVTALGIKRAAKALGYSMTELKGEELNTNVINPVSALQGKVAGVEINQSDGGMFGTNKILIRGASTLSSNNQPIYVIDGVILDNGINNSSADWDHDSGDYGNELKNLNPEDFESVSVLKGAAATALYGSRGLNGAVVITTKGSKAKQGIGVSFKQTFGIDAVTSYPRMQNMYMDGVFSGYADEREAESPWDCHNGKLFAEGKNYPSLKRIYSEEGEGCSFGNRFSDYEYLEYYDGTTVASKAIADNLRQAYDVGFNTTTNLAVSAADKTNTFYTSISEKYAKGTTPNNTFNRFNILTKASHNFNDVALLEASFTFTKSTPRNAQVNLGENFIDGTWGRAYNPKYSRDKYLADNGHWLASVASTNKYAYMPGQGTWWSLYENESYQEETVFRPDMKLTVNFTPWLKWVSQASYNYYGVKYESKQPGSGYANEGGSYRLRNTTKQQLNANTNLMFNYDINKDWNINGFLRGEYYNNHQYMLEEWTDGGLVVPNQYFLANSKNGIQSSGKIFGNKTILSVAGQFSVSWRNQIYVDVTGRNDWSSSLVYADGHGNYSYFYPSVNGSWILSETFKMPSWISFLKLRGSWAQVGNDTDAYLINSAYSLNTSTKDGHKIYSLSIPSTAYDANLKPERKNSWEVGLDWRVLGGRIGLDATYYKENTTDQIMSVSVPSASGVSTALINAGNIQNSGVEIALNTIPVQTKDFSWDLNFTFTKNNSKIVELSDLVADRIVLQGNVDYGNYRIGSVAQVGGTYGMLMTDAAKKIDPVSGLATMSYREGEGTAVYDRSGTVQEIGNSVPDFLGSVSTALHWKNFSLSISLDGRFGGYVASYGSHYGTAYGFTEKSLQYCDAAHGGITYTSRADGLTYDDGVVPEGIFMAGTKLPGGYVVGTGKYSSGETYQELYEKGALDPSHASSFRYRINGWSSAVVNDDWFTELNYIAIRDVSLSYSFPKRITESIKAKNLSLTLAGHNLGYILNTMPNGENPEAVRGTAASEFRIRNFEGVTSSFTFTINASF